MMTAKINFITNNLLVDMTCRETELRDSLQNIGILIMPSMITLDNRRTLQIQLNANDEVGEIVKTLIDTERDTFIDSTLILMLLKCNYQIRIWFLGQYSYQIL